MIGGGAKAGFSLLEVLATLALMALSLALVAPSFSTAIARIDEKSAVSRVQLQLATQRFRAVNEGVTVLVAAAPETRSVAGDEPKGADLALVPVVLSPMPGWTFAAEADLRITPGEGCSGGPLVLRQEGGQPVRLRVDAACDVTVRRGGIE